MTPPPAIDAALDAVTGLLESPAPIAAPPRRERRLTERVKVRGLWCDRGEAVDFSPRGMRLTVCRRWPEGMVRKIRLHLGDEVFEVSARCIWCRQDGMFTHSVGVAFDEIGEAARGALERWMVG